MPGQALLLLKVDEGQAEESTQPELAKGKTVGGYAYPFIDKEILEQSFPAVKRTSCIFLMVLHLKGIWFRLCRTIFG